MKAGRAEHYHGDEYTDTGIDRTGLIDPWCNQKSDDVTSKVSKQH
jgi:hypothetical protein